MARILFGAALLVAIQVGLLHWVELTVAWLVVSCFYFDEEETLQLAFFAGLFLGFVSTPFGYHLLLYVFLALIGIVLVRTIMTHRSYAAFLALCSILIPLFIVVNFFVLDAYTYIAHGRLIAVFDRELVLNGLWHGIVIAAGAIVFHLVLALMMRTRHSY